MSKTIKIILWLVVAVIVIGGIWYGLSKKSIAPTTKEPIKIGVIAPLTGGGAGFGKSLVAAIEMAKEQLSKTRYKYEIVVEDDKSNPTEAANAAQKLINVDKVKALITTTSGTGNAVAPLAELAKIPHICVCSDDAVSKGRRYSFNNLVFPEDEAKVLVSELKKRNLSKIAIISMQHPGINKIVDEIIKEANNVGIKIVFEERFVKGTTDFKTIFLKAKLKNPDIYVIQSFPPELDLIGQAYRELGIKEPLTTNAAFAISAKPELFEGFWYVDASLKDEKFKKEFVEKYPDIRFNTRSAPYGYDSFNILVAAFENNRENHMEYLDNLTEYYGKVGKLVKIGNRFKSEAQVWVIKNGTPVPYE
jgi:branched-chain amino acid transport system substrate-binding protein